MRVSTTSARVRTETEYLPYSPSERAVLRLILANGQTIDTNELTAKRWPRSANRPFNARSIINATLGNLIKKIKHNNEDFEVIKGPRKGPYPTEYRVIRRRRS